MGCLFGCFGIRDDHHRRSAHLVSEQPPANAREAVLHRNRKRLGTLLSEEKDDSLCKEKQYNIVGNSELDCDFRGLKDEAKFLKACGTLPETPAEIRKASKVLEDSPSNGDSESLKFHSWLPNTSIQKLNLEMQAEQPPTPIKLCDQWVTGSGSSSYTPSSCITSGQIPARISTSSTEDSGTGNFGIGIHTRTNQNASLQCRNKSVQFDCQSDVSTFSSKASSSEVSCQSSKRSESAGNDSVSKPSPYPTPPKLSDDMQTPGTVFPSYVRNMGNGKNPRIRSQYVYSVLNPVDNLSHWNVLKEEDSESNQQSGHLIESLEQADKANPNSEAGMMEDSVENDLKVEASLSSWLKPTNQNGNNQRVVSFASENAYFGKNLGDRPILGMVAAHWNEDEPSRISPKWWDGNGIPNSTTKYKEVPLVLFLSFPDCESCKIKNAVANALFAGSESELARDTFEERLEKALSEETSISQRKKNLSGTPAIDLNENEECDTALSQLKSSTHFNSVVSC